MAILSIVKNTEIRNAFKQVFTPLLEERVISKIFKTDQVISNPRTQLPCVAVYLDEGEEIESEFLDDDATKLVSTTVTIKFLADTNGSDEGDDIVDIIAEQGLEKLNENLTLDGLLKEDLSIEDFVYESDPNQMYTALVFRSNIQFYDK